MGGWTTDDAAAGYEISTDLSRMDLDRVHHWLSTDAYWAMGRPREKVEEAARTSLNIGVFAADGEQVGYARVVTDGATFGWVCDVYVDRAHRGRGLGVRLAAEVVSRLEPLGLKRVMLATRTAHDLYARFGFTPLPRAEDLMVLEPADGTVTGTADPPSPR